MGNGIQAFAVAAEQPKNYLKTAKQTTEQNYNMIDGQIDNTLTVDELEAKVKAGEQTRNHILFFTLQVVPHCPSCPLTKNKLI